MDTKNTSMLRIVEERESGNELPIWDSSDEEQIVALIDQRMDQRFSEMISRPEATTGSKVGREPKKNYCKFNISMPVETHEGLIA